MNKNRVTFIVGLFALLLLAFTVSAQTDQSEYMFAKPVSVSLIDRSGLYHAPEVTPSASLYLPKSTVVKLVGKAPYFYRAIYGNSIGYIPYSTVDDSYETFVSRNYPKAELKGKMIFTAALLSEPRFNGPVILNLQKDSIISLEERHNDSYWIAVYEGHIGYVGSTYVTIVQGDASTGSYQFKYPFISIFAAPRQLKTAYQSAPPRASRTPRVSQHQYYIRGPRGGCYYMTSSGRKEYVDRSLCD